MEAQGRVRTTMRYHCHSNRKVSKSQITEVLKRMYQLKRRFQKYGSFFGEHQCFMDDLEANGFSRKITSPSTDESIWYLPHHGVYHPCKPVKVRVVFDC